MHGGEEPTISFISSRVPLNAGSGMSCSQHDVSTSLGPVRHDYSLPDQPLQDMRAEVGHNMSIAIDVAAVCTPVVRCGGCRLRHVTTMARSGGSTRILVAEPCHSFVFFAFRPLP